MSTQSAHILIADDEDDIRNLLTTALTNAGFTVTAVEGGAEAIEVVQKDQPDLAILDVNMPVVDGFQVLKFIKGQLPAVKVIMLTAYASIRHATEAKRNGADDFLSKPCEIDELIEAIGRALN